MHFSTKEKIHRSVVPCTYIPNCTVVVSTAPSSSRADSSNFIPGNSNGQTFSFYCIFCMHNFLAKALLSAFVLITMWYQALQATVQHTSYSDAKCTGYCHIIVTYTKVPYTIVNSRKWFRTPLLIIRRFLVPSLTKKMFRVPSLTIEGFVYRRYLYKVLYTIVRYKRFPITLLDIKGFVMYSYVSPVSCKCACRGQVHISPVVDTS